MAITIAPLNDLLPAEGATIGHSAFQLTPFDDVTFGGGGSGSIQIAPVTVGSFEFVTIQPLGDPPQDIVSADPDTLQLGALSLGTSFLYSVESLAGMSLDFPLTSPQPSGGTSSGTSGGGTISINDFVGATANMDGKHGLVPAPLAGEDDLYLRGSGGWSPYLLGTESSTIEGAMWLAL